MQRLARHLSSSSASLAISNRGRSCTQCQRYSVAASSTVSDTSPQRRRRGKVSISERRSLVESFVNKYRVMNAGKFPTPSHVTSAVGGSYYTVKKIVQELQHESQTPSAGMVHNNQQQYERVEKESEPLSSSVEDSCGQMTACEGISVDTLIGTSLGNEEDNKSEPLSYANQSPNSEDISSKIADDVDTRVLERDVETEGEVPEIVEKESEPLSSSVEDSCGQMTVCEGISVDTLSLIGTSLGNEGDSKSKPLSYADQSPNSEDIGSKIADDVYTRVLERDFETEGEVPEIVDVNKEEVSLDTQFHGSAVSRNMASGLQEVSKEISSSKDNGPADTTKEVYMSEEGHGIMPTSKISLNESEELADTKYVPGLGVGPKDCQEETTEVGESTRNLEKDVETEKESFAWKHMKLLADGILKIWRKL